MNYKGRYGGYSHYGSKPQVNTSHLFVGSNLDVEEIRRAIDKRQLRHRDMENHFNNVVNDAKRFNKWRPEERLANAITVAAYLTTAGLRTNQVRKILEMARTMELKIKRSDKDIKSDVIRMRYLLAYTVGKASNRQAQQSLEAFHSVLNPMLEVLMSDTSEENFEKFYDFLQAVVAYHKFFGGKEQ